MNILFLGYDNCDLLNFLHKQCTSNDRIFQKQTPIDLQECLYLNPDLIISYGYRHIIQSNIVEYFDGKLLNLHISMLPWNRGCHPNLWSIIDNTPKGVSIHLIDVGLDTGDILYQQEIDINNQETLASIYQKLQNTIQQLFISHWSEIASLKFQRFAQKVGGSYNSCKSSEDIINKLNITWDITVENLQKRLDADIIADVEQIRSKNNTYWMDLVRLAFDAKPTEARAILKNIKDCDAQINTLLNELSTKDNDEVG